MNYRYINIEYNSFSEFHKKPFGAIRINEEITFRIQVEKAYNADVTLVIAKEGHGERYIRMVQDDNNYHTTTYSADETGLCFYFFIVNYHDYDLHRTIYVGSPGHSIGGEQVIKENRWDITPYQITFHDYIKPAPSWYKDTIFYQIYVDRFYNGNEDKRVNSPKKNSFLYATWEDSPMYIKDSQGNIIRWDFFGGNLLGVMKKLDYLKELGIGGIYLNPIFKARSNHKYDTGDYLAIDEMFGDENLFQLLIDEAAKRGIRIVLDGVFNHVGADSRYFNAFGNYPELGAAESKDSVYFPWFNFFNYPNEYESWWGVKDLPNVNENNPSYRNFIVGKDGVIEKWTKMGIGGWRLDVADEMPDDFIKDIRTTMNHVSDDSVLIGEVWEDASNKIAYGKRRRYLLGDELHATMNYPFKDGVIAYLNGHVRARELYTRFMSLKENYPSEAFYSALNNLGTHDTKRIFTEIDDISRLSIAVGMLLTFPGVPCIYYGDEAGMKGESDPYNRGPYPWGNEVPEIFEIYKNMINLRQSDDAFSKGDFIPFYQENLFGYLRKTEDSTYLIIINREPEEARLVIRDSIGLESVLHDVENHLEDSYQLKHSSFNCIKIK